jgi:hypothetical protein
MTQGVMVPLSEDAPKKPWEEDYGSEEQFLYAYGFSRARELGEDLWRHGSAGSADKAEAANVYTRQQAFEKIAEWRDRHE